MLGECICVSTLVSNRLGFFMINLVSNSVYIASVGILVYVLTVVWVISISNVEGPLNFS